MLLTTFVFELPICALHGSPEFANGMMQTPFKLAPATIQDPILFTETKGILSIEFVLNLFELVHSKFAIKYKQHSHQHTKSDQKKKKNVETVRRATKIEPSRI